MDVYSKFPAVSLMVGISVSFSFYFFLLIRLLGLHPLLEKEFRYQSNVSTLHLEQEAQE